MSVLVAAFLFSASLAVAGEMEELVKSVVTTSDGMNYKRIPCAKDQVLALPRPEKKQEKRCSGSKSASSGQATLISTDDGKSVAATEVSEQELEELSNYLAGKARRYGLTEDSHVRKATCAPRAQMVALDFLHDCGVKSMKVFAKGNFGLVTEKLGNSYLWDDYHVANVVYVRKNGKLEPYVIDKLLSDGPLSLAAWKAKLNSSGSIQFKITDPSVRTPSDEPHPSFRDQELENWASKNITEKINEGVRLRH